MGKVAGSDELAVISRVIHDDDRRPIFVYRVLPLSLDDSGWTATVGESPEGIKSAAVTVAHIRHLVEHWPELAAVFADDRDESAWEWDEACQYRELDPSL